MNSLVQELSHAAAREIAPEHAVLCTRYIKALRELGWVPEVGLREGLVQTLEWYRSRG